MEGDTTMTHTEELRELFVWSFVMTNEEIAEWIALSDRMRGHISARLDERAELLEACQVAVGVYGALSVEGADKSGALPGFDRELGKLREAIAKAESTT